MAQLPKRNLGSQGLEVSTLGLGCMGLSTWYGKPVEEEEAVALVHHAFNNGVTFFDTSDAYGPHTNEKIARKGSEGFASRQSASGNKVRYHPGRWQDGGQR